ncbi:bifunctional 3'-5' exonuclease/DNA polymerase [Microbacteriaceae bacterium VKM Ac-2855]|nr:bifunctional 3'-5' exonuclease/DNA polymerase [Microbacteriaceae bacterium VKM Ac-2855]
MAEARVVERAAGERREQSVRERRSAVAAQNGLVFALLTGSPVGAWSLLLLDDGLGAIDSVAGEGAAALAEAVRGQEAERVRWAWDDTARWYPVLLRAGIRVARSHDLRLARAILRRSVAAQDAQLARMPTDSWDAVGAAPADADALFDSGAFTADASDAPDCVRELALQEEAIRGSTAPGRLRLLIAAESSGALIAREIAHEGLPWRADVHDRILTEALGPRPVFGGRPERLEALAARIRTELNAPELNPDSPATLVRALRRAGVAVESTSSWELKRIEHPVIDPLLEYKKLARLLSANGWAWLDAWVRDGRFRPDYVVGGVVTGRWATSGGGALQLPKQIRAAVVADSGWKLVVADAAQLEPRILAAMADDQAMAEAGRGRDLYQGIVDSGVVEDRAHAKVAMLGAMYGATTGESGRLMPRLARAYPRSVALVEHAARVGEKGERVSTWLGRSSPFPSEEWAAEQAEAYTVDGSAEQQRRARTRARDWGRFTRNFVVQGTAAEWALCWMGELRSRLRALDPAPLQDAPHLVYFLHDEVIVHTPACWADQVAAIITAAAEASGRALFGPGPVDFPVQVAIVDSYAEAK